MNFCPLCGTLLAIEQSQYVELTCPACPYVHRLVNPTSRTIHREIKRCEAVADETEAIETGNRCASNCPKCFNNEAYYVEMQTRSADEPATIFYRCTKCSHNWKE